MLTEHLLFPDLVLIKTKHYWISLAVQWIRIHLPVQGTQVQSLLWEDSTGRRAPKPLGHNC